MFLDDIVANKKIQVESQKKVISLDVLKEKCKGLTRVKPEFKSKIKKEDNTIKLIAEIKKASPSKGIINNDIIPDKLAMLYEKSGADAISVLTEKKYFLGDDSFIGLIKDAVKIPVLRKDFIVDEYQVYESKVLGADAVLLIAAVLNEDLPRYLNLATSAGLDALVEVHDEMELDMALKAGADIIGINNRNLKDFTVDIRNTEKLIGKIPENIIKISESGIKNSLDIKYLKKLGVDAVLIGETLVRSNDVPGTIKEFKSI